MSYLDDRIVVAHSSYVDQDVGSFWEAKAFRVPAFLLTLDLFTNLITNNERGRHSFHGVPKFMRSILVSLLSVLFGAFHHCDVDYFAAVGRRGAVSLEGGLSKQ